MRNAQVTILNAVNTTSQTGGAVDVGQAVSASFVVINGDASAAGAVKIQCSNAAPPAGYLNIFVPPTNSWADIPSATSTIASGVGPAIVIGNMCFRYIRAVYTRVSGGSSIITVQMNILSQ